MSRQNTLETAQSPVLQEEASYAKSGFRYGCYRLVKRVFDTVSAFIVLVVLTPLILLCLLVKFAEDAVHPRYALTIVPAGSDKKPKGRVTRVTRASDGAVLDCILTPVKPPRGKRLTNPVYLSTRVGRGGKEFRMLKIRSMIPGAEEMKDQLIAAGLNEADPPAFKMKDDPRITPVGKILRKLSIDELLQLINIVGGSMSVVGPRPPIPCEVADYTPQQRHRLDVKSGLLCLWQVQKNRNALSFDEWCRLDFEYIWNQSILLDLRIIFRGAWMVLFDRSGE